MTSVKVALDWTPNTNHIGFFVAQAKGFYEAAGLQVELISPDADGYKQTPRMQVEKGEAMFGVAPSESVISCHTSGEDKPKLVAVAALLQKQTSAVVTLKSSGIDRPSMLDGKKYASYEGRFEMGIVRQLIINDGGAGTVEEVCPGEHGLGIFETLVKSPGTYDATWVFMPWEGVIAKRSGVDLNVFSLDSIDYGYSPILLTHPDTVSQNPEIAKKFLAATAEGYTFAVTNKEESVEILSKAAKHKGIDVSKDMLADSLEELGPAILNKHGKWGAMEGVRWRNFTSWLFSNKLIKDRNGADIDEIDPSNLFTNELL